MILLRKIKIWCRRKLPRRKDLRGTFLHRVIGEGLFDKHLWKPSRREVAAGFAVGTFISLTPSYGFQMILAGFLAYIWRVNIPMALIACWITNPITIPIILAYQIKLGVFLTGKSILQSGLSHGHTPSHLIKFIRPLTYGCLSSAIFFSAAAYLFAIYLWDFFQYTLQKKNFLRMTRKKALRDEKNRNS